MNRLRQLRRQLRLVQERLGAGDAALGARLRGGVEGLSAIEAALVDVKRESPRDVLRHQAGLDDTLGDLVSVVAIADEAPTQQAREVSQETLARVDAELGRLGQWIAEELPALNLALRGAGVEPAGLPRA